MERLASSFTGVAPHDDNPFEPVPLPEDPPGFMEEDMEEEEEDI